MKYISSIFEEEEEEFACEEQRILQLGCCVIWKDIIRSRTTATEESVEEVLVEEVSPLLQSVSQSVTQRIDS